jgi:hypothetical protein
VYPSWHKPTLELPEMQHIRHYRLAVAGQDTAFAGCSCRGCDWARQRANSHVAGPVRVALNSWAESQRRVA